MRKEISQEFEQFMFDVRKSAKLRAPRDTGELAQSIIVEKMSPQSWVLLVQSPYGVYQEQGFKPHWIHSSQIIQSQKLKGSNFFFVSKHTPFVQPALEHNLSRLSQRMENATNKAIRKSRGKK